MTLKTLHSSLLLRSLGNHVILKTVIMSRDQTFVLPFLYEIYFRVNQQLIGKSSFFLFIEESWLIHKEWQNYKVIMLQFLV